MKTDIGLTFKNNYHVELIDAVTGEIKQEGDFHNTPTTNMHTLFIGGPSGGSGGYCGLMSFMAIGTGSGTPQYTDTGLFNMIGSKIRGTNHQWHWVDNHTGRCTVTYIFPAESTYVGNITEIGLFSDSQGKATNYMTTHALLTDSEGQPISFNKTDLDVLKIAVTIELSFKASGGFSIFNHPYLLLNSLMGNYNSNQSYYNLYGGINLCRYYFNLDTYTSFKNWNRTSGPEIDKSLISSQKGTITPETRSSYMDYAVTRLLATDITSETYYKGIALPGLGYWRLPNEEIFPAYTISGLNIGTGDGITTQFTNPLCYFKKGTDKVYKNGVLLTRDVDYTLNNMSNSKCLPEIAEMAPPISIDSRHTKITTISPGPLIMPTSCSYAHIEGYDFSTVFNANYPLYVEYEEEVTFNCLKCTTGLKTLGAGGGYSNIPTGSVFYVDYSADGETYVELGSAATVNTDAAFNIDFENTTAKYWRIRTNVTTEVGFYPNVGYLTLNFKDPYITFTQPPAEGDILTMDVDMDIIMKNSNFVVDLGCRIEFKI